MNCNTSVLPEIPVIERVTSDFSEDFIAFVFIVRQSRGTDLDCLTKKNWTSPFDPVVEETTIF